MRPAFHGQRYPLLRGPHLAPNVLLLRPATNEWQLTSERKRQSKNCRGMRTAKAFRGGWAPQDEAPHRLQQNPAARARRLRRGQARAQKQEQRPKKKGGVRDCEPHNNPGTNIKS
eukprot:14674177-Alexandrium_andersonii.AAC.1